MPASISDLEEIGSHQVNAEKPWMSSGPSGYRTHSERYPLDLFSYTREAAHCLIERRFLAVIAMSSTAVELIMSRDSRTRKLSSLRRIGGWATLNNFKLEGHGRAWAARSGSSRRG